MDYGWMASLLLTLQSELSDMAGLVRVLLGVLLPGAGYVGRCGRGRCGSAAVRPAPPRRTAKSCRNSQQLPGTATAEATRHTEEHSQLQQAASPGTMVSVEQLQVTTSTSHPQHLVSNVQCPGAVCRSSGRTIGSPVCKIGHTAKSWRVCCSAAAGRHSAARGHCGHVTTSLIPAIRHW